MSVDRVSDVFRYPTEPVKTLVRREKFNSSLLSMRLSSQRRKCAFRDMFDVVL